MLLTERTLATGGERRWARAFRDGIWTNSTVLPTWSISIGLWSHRLICCDGCDWRRPAHCVRRWVSSRGYCGVGRYRLSFNNILFCGWLGAPRRERRCRRGGRRCANRGSRRGLGRGSGRGLERRVIKDDRGRSATAASAAVLTTGIRIPVIDEARGAGWIVGPYRTGRACFLLWRHPFGARSCRQLVFVIQSDLIRQKATLRIQYLVQSYRTRLSVSRRLSYAYLAW